LSGVKKLAGQTLWYGLPTIASRFLGYIMNMALPFLFTQPAVTADLTQVYALIPFLNILFTYGVETAYFRYSGELDRPSLFSTLFTSLLVSTVLFSGLLYISNPFIAGVTGLNEHSSYLNWMLGILFFDTLATLPFARLRQENRPKKYAVVRIAGIAVNILIVFIFLGVLPSYLQQHPDSYLHNFYDEQIGIGYYLIGNFLGSLLTFLLLAKEWTGFRFKFDAPIWKTAMTYSYPLIIVGLGGMINDMLSRLVYQHVVDLPHEQAQHELGVFANLYRIAVLITIMIQAFRMAAEPFFFNRAGASDAKQTYARIMNFFVIACCLIFLLIGVYLDGLKWIITLKSEAWGEGMEVVLLLALGNIFLGIYYNMSIWYKLTNKNLYGAALTIGGAVLTIVLNILLIPTFHYWGAAAATFCCYLFMMGASYLLGQKHYPVPYDVKKIASYLLFVVFLVVFHRFLVSKYEPLWFSLTSGTTFVLLFIFVTAKKEKQELKNLPVVGKWVASL
jgi:O-antigen/teichoic acid export membrane protein